MGRRQPKCHSSECPLISLKPLEPGIHSTLLSAPLFARILWEWPLGCSVQSTACLANTQAFPTPLNPWSGFHDDSSGPVSASVTCLPLRWGTTAKAAYRGKRLFCFAAPELRGQHCEEAWQEPHEGQEAGHWHPQPQTSSGDKDLEVGLNTQNPHKEVLPSAEGTSFP